MDEPGYSLAGPLGVDRFAAFCLVRTVRISAEPRRNAAASTCKVCGDRLEKGRGYGCSLIGERIDIPALKEIYLCARCFRPVLRAYRDAVEWAWLKSPRDVSKYPQEVSG